MNEPGRSELKTAREINQAAGGDGKGVGVAVLMQTKRKSQSKLSKGDRGCT